MSNSHLSAAPNDPYTWRESVLSTRSLSYLSTAGSMTGLSNPRDRSTSNTARRPPTRQSTEMTDDSDYSLEMAGGRDMELNDIAELPETVARSPLFLLPQEIRDRVYAHCMTADENAEVEWPAATARHGLQPQLLRTCSTIHNEAGPFLYKLNNIGFHHPSDANMFVRALTSPSFSKEIQHLTLHMRGTDTRLWMPYLTSRDKTRSLRSDYPNLRTLNLRFRSNQWQHNLSAEQNMKIWSADNRLDEVIDGIRNVYYAGALPSRRSKGLTRDSQAPYIPPRSFDHSLDDPDARGPPTIRLTCICRVAPAHFATLTTPLPSTSSSPSGSPSPASSTLDLSSANNGTGVIQQTPPTAPLGFPIREGAPFTRFGPVDLRSATVRIMQVEDGGKASAVSTVFADRDGIGLALEIYCLEGRRDAGPGLTA